MDDADIAVPPPVPDKLMEIIYAYRASKALFVACKLGIFDVLNMSPTPVSCKSMAEELTTDVDGTSRLMDTLVALQLLEKIPHNEPECRYVYSNTKIATQFLTKSSPYSMFSFIEFSNQQLYPLFGNLESAVRDGSSQWINTFGKPSEAAFKAIYTTEEERVTFLKAMHGSSLPSCHRVVKAFDLSQFTTCCDLGGATGALAYAMCQHYPHMKITVVDLLSVKESSPNFRPTLEDCPNQENVSFAVGDFFQPSLPSADLYVLCRILHDWSEEKVDLILDNVYNCLPSGGGLLVCEIILEENKTGPLSGLLSTLNMLVCTGGKERSAGEYKQLLEKHGFGDIQVKKSTDSLPIGAVLCRKI